jgi:Fis family transcriptional regulator
VEDQLAALVTRMYRGGIRYDEAVREFKKMFLLTVLREHHGNVSEAARNLGIHRNTLGRTIAELGLDLHPLRAVPRRPPRSERALAAEKKASR